MSTQSPPYPPIEERHPHEVVASALLGGSGHIAPEGEELEKIVRIFEAHHELLFVIVPLVVTYFLVLRCCFQSWSIGSAAAAWKAGESVESRYNMAFDRRAELTSQINAARIHREEARLSTLRSQLADLDEEIDLVEDEIRGDSSSGASTATRASAEELRRRRAANPNEA